MKPLLERPRWVRTVACSVLILWLALLAWLVDIGWDVVLDRLFG